MISRTIDSLFGERRTLEIPCTVDVECTFDSLHAYVDLDGDVDISPGDEVIVHGPPVRIEFGQHFVERRTATVVKANALGRLSARLTGALELTELYEVSFSPRIRL